MPNTSFIGRKEELRDLKLLLNKKTASLVVVQGRRRIGKSRLVQEFGKQHQFYQFTGFPPSEVTTAQSQRNEFARQLNITTGLPELKVDDWSKLFFLLAKEVAENRKIILFDEISWMGSKDSDFLGKLKNAWDLYFKQNPELILILCGSVSAWIEKNILSHTGFLGRISLTLTLHELPLQDCNLFFASTSKNYISCYEKFKILTVTGGIPRYLEEVQPTLTAEENIKRLCFSPKGILFREFNDIFSDLFSKRGIFYKKIVELLVEAPIECNDIFRKLNLSKSGHLSEHLNDLLRSGFITRDYTWHLKTSVESRLSHYRLSDNYLRFYLKYIEKNKPKIERGHFDDRSPISLPGLETILGLQFENIVLNNRKLLWQMIHLSPEEIRSDNPFFQRKTENMPGCQIDYLIQTRFNTLYVCEIKFSKHAIDVGIIHEMQRKISTLKRPKGFSCRPVLIHVNGVQEEVIESGYFAQIIDLCNFLDGS